MSDDTSREMSEVEQRWLNEHPEFAAALQPITPEMRELFAKAPNFAAVPAVQGEGDEARTEREEI